MSANEAAVQAEVRLEAARRGVLLWRNNSGALKDETGRLVRYGLGNDSTQTNRVMKSADLIGIGPGGIMHAYEVKRPGWKYTGTEREVAQLAFLDLVRSRGGVAAFVTCIGDMP